MESPINDCDIDDVVKFHLALRMKAFSEGKRVVYIPNHANGNSTHKDVEHGTVSSKNSTYIFVKFNKQVAELGWEGTTAQACHPDNLQLR